MGVRTEGGECVFCRERSDLGSRWLYWLFNGVTGFTRAVIFDEKALGIEEVSANIICMCSNRTVSYQQTSLELKFWSPTAILRTLR